MGGMLVADKFHPIFDNWNEGPFVSSMASHFSETAAKNFWPAFWVMTMGHELATTLQDYEGKEEFDYGFDPLNLSPEDPEKEKEYKTMELNHGRWAMFCAAGIIAQELVRFRRLQLLSSPCGGVVRTHHFGFLDRAMPLRTCSEEVLRVLNFLFRSTFLRIFF